MEIKLDSKYEKGALDLYDSLYDLRKSFFHLMEKQVGPIFNIFCVGSPFHVEFSMSTLPYVMEHGQIDSGLYEKMKDALTPGPGHMAKPFPGKTEFLIDRNVIYRMKERIRKASSEGKCSRGLEEKIDHVIELLNGTVYDRRFLKIPLNLIYANESSPTKLVSMFQMIEEGNKPVITHNIRTGEETVIRRPFIPNLSVHGTIWMLLGSGGLKVDTDGYVSLTQLGAEVATLFEIGRTKRSSNRAEWEYIYGPFLIFKCFEDLCRSSEIGRIAEILDRENEPVSIYKIMDSFASEGSIDNLTWPEWAIPAMIEKKGGKLNYKVKQDTFSYLGHGIEMYMEWLIKTRWVEENEITLRHNDGVREHEAHVPGYALTDAGRAAFEIIKVMPKILPCLKENALHPGIGYLNFRRFVVLQAITTGHDTPETIREYAEKLGVSESVQIIDDVVEDLIRCGLYIEREGKIGHGRRYVSHNAGFMSDAPLSEMHTEKPEYLTEKDQYRERFPMFKRKHMILFDLANRKRIIKYSKKNEVGLFRAWLTDMIRNAGVRCEMFGGSEGPDVIVNESGFVAYISVEGVFDENPDISMEKMAGDLNDKESPFRKFINPEDRNGTIYYAFLVKNEDTFEKKRSILKSISRKTGNENGCVISMYEIMEVFNEAAAKGEKKNIGRIIERLFDSKRGGNDKKGKTLS